MSIHKLQTAGSSHIDMLQMKPFLLLASIGTGKRTVKSDVTRRRLPTHADRVIRPSVRHGPCLSSRQTINMGEGYRGRLIPPLLQNSSFLTRHQPRTEKSSPGLEGETRENLVIGG